MYMVTEPTWTYLEGPVRDIDSINLHLFHIHVLNKCTSII